MKARAKPTDSMSGAERQSGAPDVSVLIVAYNSQECIGDCIQSVILGAQNRTVQILMVDNGDGESERRVADRFPHVEIVESEGNVGFAKANNGLVERAKAPHLLFVNPDAILSEDAIDLLVDAARKHEDIGAFGAVTIDEEGQPDMGNAIPVPSLAEYWSRAIGRARAGRNRPTRIDRDEEAEVLSGSCLMIRRSAWNAVGGFDERFFLYCEEVDLCVRLREAGHDLMRVAQARARHRIAHGNIHSPRRRLYQAAGNVEFMRKHWSAPRRWIGIVLIWFAATLRYLMGRAIGTLRPHLKAQGNGHRIVAMRPALWVSGYHPRTGLKARLDRGESVLGAE